MNRANPGTAPAKSSDVRTHRAIDPDLCGTPVEVGEGRSRVRLTTTPPMAADEHGLVHGGFVFGLADHAAMLAVNHANVVLAAAEVRFLLPVRVGETVEARAELEAPEGSPPNPVGVGPGGDEKPWVRVEVERDGQVVLTGRFRCYVPGRHVLER